MTPPRFGPVLGSRFPPGDDGGARFAEQVQQVHHARDAGFDSVWATQHYLAEEFQYLHPPAVPAATPCNARSAPPACWGAPTTSAGSGCTPAGARCGR